MEIKKVLKGQFQFLNECKSTRNGFCHKTTLFDNNGNQIATKTNNYLNRTWECYQYQSVMRCCLCKRIEKLQKEFLEKWKSEKNIKRFLKKEKEIA